MAQPPGIIYSTTVSYTGSGGSFSYPYPTVLLITTDASGNTYVAGAVASAGLPTTPGVVQPQYKGGTCYVATPGEGPCPNAFIAKFNSSGTLLFLTYLGGEYASIPSGLAVDQAGYIYIGIAANGISYVTRLSPRGTGLSWLTEVGANTEPQLALTPDGSLLCLAGLTLTKFSTSSGQPLSSFMAPAGSQAIAGAPDGSVYIGGQAYTSLLPTPGAWQTTLTAGVDGFVAKLNPSLSGFAWLTYAGSPVNLLRAAPDGSVWATGGTTDPDFPVLPGAWQTHLSGGDTQSGFLVHLSADGSKALASTYLPAPIASLALDSFGDVVFSSTQQDFEPTPGAQWPCEMPGSLNAGFLGKIDPPGQHLLWGTGAGPAVPIGPATIDANDDAVAAGHVPGVPVNSLGAGDVILTAMTTVPGPSRLVSSCIGQAGFPYLPGPLAPGEIVSIYGAGFGPQQGVSAQPSGHQFGTELGGVQVLVEDTPVPLLYVSAAQINFVAPFLLYGRSAAHIKIVTADGTSDEVVLGVTQAIPEILTNSSGDAIINQDGTINDFNHPAHIGDAVSMYISGAGQTSPPGVDGAIPQAAGAAPLLPLTIQLTAIGNPPSVNATYAGNAPGIVSGVTQVNFQVPQLVLIGPPGAANQANVTVVVGGATSNPPGYGYAIPPSLYYIQ